MRHALGHCWARVGLKWRLVGLLALGLPSIALLPPPPGPAVAAGAPTASLVPFVVGGSSAVVVRPTVDAFRAALGPNNGTGGPQAAGRREITWDDVPDSLAAPNTLPADFFNQASPRGVVLSGPGAGFEVSASPLTNVLPFFGDIHPPYAALFNAYSAPRLFTALRSTWLDATFYVPGTRTPATVSGFGAVFVNVRNPNTTSVEYFDTAGTSLGLVFAPPGAFAFAGARIDAAGPRIARVRLHNGNTPVGVNDAPSAIDIVVMDDFIYGEPQSGSRPAVVVPAPLAPPLGPPLLAPPAYPPLLPPPPRLAPPLGPGAGTPGGVGPQGPRTPAATGVDPAAPAGRTGAESSDSPVSTERAPADPPIAPLPQSGEPPEQAESEER